MTPAEEFTAALAEAFDLKAAADALDIPEGDEDKGWYPEWGGPESGGRMTKPTPYPEGWLTPVCTFCLRQGLHQCACGKHPPARKEHR